MGGDAALPEWADPRLVVRLTDVGDRPEWADQDFVVDGNPHTFAGLVRIVGLADGIAMSVRPDDLVAPSDYVAGWLAGYLHGSEPRPTSDLAPLARIEREHEFFHRHGYALDRRRSAAAVVAAICVPNGATPLGDVYCRIAELVTSLGRMLPGWPDDWLAEDSGWMEPLRLRSRAEVQAAFEWLNPGYAVAADVYGERELHLANDTTPSLALGAVGLTVNVWSDGEGHVDQVECSVALEPEAQEWADAILETAVAVLKPDLAATTAGIPLRESASFGVTVGDSDRVWMVPGSRTFVSFRVDRLDLQDVDPAGYTRRRTDAGVLFEFAAAPAEFDLAAANRLAAALDPTAGPRG